MKLFGKESVIQSQKQFRSSSGTNASWACSWTPPRRSWCHIAWQTVPDLCTSNRKSIWPPTVDRRR